MNKIYLCTNHNSIKYFTVTLKPITHDSIQPTLLICPNSSIWLTDGCNQTEEPSSGHSKRTLIKGTDICYNVQVLAGQCSNHKTIYYADHECTPAASGWGKTSNAICHLPARQNPGVGTWQMVAKLAKCLNHYWDIY